MKIFITCLVLLSSAASNGQTTDEWVNQKATQLRYLLQQIAAIQAYTQVTERGYTILKDSTAVIATIKEEDVNLNSDYFSSLSTVRPGIPKQTTGIITDYDRIVSITDGIRLITPAADDFLNGLLKECISDMDWLTILTKDGQIMLKDDQRLAGIMAVQNRMNRRLTDALRARNLILEMKLNGRL